MKQGDTRSRPNSELYIWDKITQVLRKTYPIAISTLGHTAKFVLSTKFYAYTRGNSNSNVNENFM